MAVALPKIDQEESAMAVGTTPTKEREYWCVRNIKGLGFLNTE